GKGTQDHATDWPHKKPQGKNTRSLQQLHCLAAVRKKRPRKIDGKGRVNIPVKPDQQVGQGSPYNGLNGTGGRSNCDTGHILIVKQPPPLQALFWCCIGSENKARLIKKPTKTREDKRIYRYFLQIPKFLVLQRD